MTKKEAKDIIYAYENTPDTGCTCRTGNPPCSWCVEFPGEEFYNEAIKFLEENE